jgi:hypothetical protein
MAVQMDQLFLYARAGCHLCDEARAILDDVLRERAAAGLPSPAVVERDIDSDEGWRRAFLATIPVIEFGGRRLELAVSPARIRRLLADVLDASPATT